MQLTDILRILLLETEATEMIPIVDKETSASRNRDLNTSMDNQQRAAHHSRQAPQHIIGVP